MLGTYIQYIFHLSVEIYVAPTKLCRSNINFVWSISILTNERLCWNVSHAFKSVMLVFFQIIDLILKVCMHIKFVIVLIWLVG